MTARPAYTTGIRTVPTVLLPAPTAALRAAASRPSPHPPLLARLTLPLCAALPRQRAGRPALQAGAGHPGQEGAVQRLPRPRHLVRSCISGLMLWSVAGCALRMAAARGSMLWVSCLCSCAPAHVLTNARPLLPTILPSSQVRHVLPLWCAPASVLVGELRSEVVHSACVQQWGYLVAPPLCPPNLPARSLCRCRLQCGAGRHCPR